MVYKAREKIIDFTVRSDKHVDNLIPEWVLLELGFHHAQRSRQQTQIVEHGEADQTVDVSLHSGKDIGERSHFCDVTTHVDEVVKYSILNRLSTKCKWSEHVVGKPVCIKWQFAQICRILSFVTDQMLAFYRVVKQFTDNVVAHKHVNSHEDDCAMTAQVTIEVRVPPRKQVSNEHDHSS